MKKDDQITGNVGLYYVCYCLSIMGSNAIPTVMPTASTTMGKGKIRIRRDFNPICQMCRSDTIEVLTLLRFLANLWYLVCSSTHRQSLELDSILELRVAWRPDF